MAYRSSLNTVLWLFPEDLNNQYKSGTVKAKHIKSEYRKDIELSSVVIYRNGLDVQILKDNIL